MKDDSFNEETLNGLLTVLHTDREQAGELYTLWHTRLVNYFAWRGVTTPEDCADEVLRRAGESIYKGVEVKNLGRYIFGIARHVRFEYYKRDILDPLDEDFNTGAGPTLEPTLAQQDERLECLTRCLDSLSPANREMLLAYYADEKNIEPRKQLAALLGISINNLHLRVYRLRQRLGECIDLCLKERTGLK